MKHSGWLRFLVGMGFVAVAVGCGGQDSTSFALMSELPAPDGPGAEPTGSTAAPGAASTSDADALVQSEHVKTLRQADGSFASEVNATSMQSWVYFSLQAHAEVTPDQPEQSDSWDLAFQRSNVKLNGGTSGAGGVTVSSASGSFESVQGAPAEGYVADAADADLDGSPDYAFGAGDGWYSYDPASHALTARDTVFVVKTARGYFKLQFSSYYDAAGTPGMPQFRWAPLGGS
ncbi:MAG: HmuY family protein [Deltaproteobacteria bacterium]